MPDKTVAHIQKLLATIDGGSDGARPGALAKHIIATGSPAANGGSGSSANYHYDALGAHIRAPINAGSTRSANATLPRPDPCCRRAARSPRT